MDFIRKEVRGMYLSSRTCSGGPAGLVSTCARAWEDRQLAHGKLLCIYGHDHGGVRTGRVGQAMHNMRWMWTAASKGIDGDRGRRNEGISVEMKRVCH